MIFIYLAGSISASLIESAMNMTMLPEDLYESLDGLIRVHVFISKSKIICETIKVKQKEVIINIQLDNVPKFLPLHDLQMLLSSVVDPTP
jgi:hypothetical protein